MSIAWQELGDGPIDLVLVPGIMSHVEEQWDNPVVARLLRRLASFSRLILFDKREQGLSDRFGRPPTLEESMGDLRAVLDAAGSERAAVLGVSEGGPMAILLAATHPERCSHLALLGTWARLARADDNPGGLPPHVIDATAERLQREWGGPAGIALLAPGLAGDAEAERWWARALRLASSPSAVASLLTLSRDIDVREALPLVAAPTLVLHRRDDTMVPLALGRHLAAEIPGAQFVELSGRDHAWFAGDVDAWVDEVEEFLTGARAAAAPERVLATVLFTDIVDSTRRAAELGDRAWRILLDRHDALVARRVEQQRGRVVKSTGDGVLATFDGPARGIACARTLQAEVGELGLEVRAGLHTGECERRGDDVGGMAVHIGARVAARAGAGEILVSSTVKDLVVGSGTRFAARGAAELKGVPGEWRLFAVT